MGLHQPQNRVQHIVTHSHMGLFQNRYIPAEKCHGDYGTNHFIRGFAAFQKLETPTWRHGENSYGEDHQKRKRLGTGEAWDVKVTSKKLVVLDVHPSNLGTFNLLIDSWTITWEHHLPGPISLLSDGYHLFGFLSLQAMGRKRLLMGRTYCCLFKDKS